MRRILWLGAFALLPLPVYVAVPAVMPPGRLLMLTALVIGAVAAEGSGGVSRLLIGVFSAQLVGYLGILWIAARIVSALLVRLVGRRASVVALAGLALGAAWTSTNAVYRTPLGVYAIRSNLWAAYRWPVYRTESLRRVGDAPAQSAAAAPSEATTAEPCLHRNPLRNPYFGDTHIHTALSFDAVGQGTRNRPRDAYRFARGEALGIQPYDSLGKPAQTVQLRRPLDFAMVSDHSELLGETRLCFDPDEAGYDSYVCWLVRTWPRLGYMVVNGDMFSNAPPKRYSFCGEGGERCTRISAAPWREIQEAAEEAYDRSADCSFTAFVGYEWTGMPGGNNTHRNIVFRNEVVPPLPVNYIDTPTEEGLWEELHRTCTALDGGCDLLVIPHNSNASNGRLFRVETADGHPIDAELARRRAELEVLAEVTQHKGDSECRHPAASGDDPLCAYETPPGSTIQEIVAPVLVREPAPLSFVREVLAEGVVQHARLGVNPFRFGLIGSTDTHLGTPGMVDEDLFVGHGAGLVSRLVAVPAIPDGLMLNPGGLAVLWAEENSRESLFAAMRRREAFGTSGPRLLVRMFGGWGYDEAMCEGSDFAEAGYAGGVPMGGRLAPPVAGGAAPRFAVWALKDPGVADAPGTPLQRIQIIKVWEERGEARERVYDVVGDAENGAAVDLETCTPTGVGFDQLCSVWSDPDFDSAHHSAYYTRVIENPSCRWNRHVCNAHGVDCASPETVEDGLGACCDPGVPQTIQERAWTSPIWFTPAEKRGETGGRSSPSSRAGGEARPGRS